MFLRAASLLLLMVWRSEQVCAPDCSGVDSMIRVRDPTDCTRYYVCLDASNNGEMIASIDSVSCPDDYYFNESHTVPRCDPLTTLPDPCRSTCDPCVPHCLAPGKVTPHPTNCSLYYVCLDDNLLLDAHCPPETRFFDYRSGVCTDDNSVCYSYCDLCVPHCTTPGERVPDPYDCTKFHLCVVGGMVSYMCPHHRVFNSDTQLCEDNIECISPCTNLSPEMSTGDEW
ncbi:peritrophin-1 isoform X2 [Procambarus clarkii]|uniref:peritrophin-1 isoform X2 n=1 Tax=Procambarus clarkii TaxID=6728 RepID=UPI001E671E22|nr:peritrophin-1-like isoform X2 [Procambarus clarkii]